jgi:hypothetical protein
VAKIDMDAAVAEARAVIWAREAEKIVGASGPRGERGIPGLPPKLFIGNVIESNKANATLEAIEGTENEYRLNLQLPRGRDGQTGERGAIGAASTIAGPAGRPGRDGTDAQSPSQEDIEKAVRKVLEANVEKFRGRSVVGPAGERGESGRTPKIAIGTCIEGNTASAKIRVGDDGVHYVDLTLPRGPQGERGFRGLESTVPGPEGKPSNVAGPQGEPGTPGKDSTVPGPKGDSGMTREEIAQIMIEVMQQVGVMTEQAQKLIAIRAKLKAAIHQADARHVSQVAEIIRDVDKLF